NKFNRFVIMMPASCGLPASSSVGCLVNGSLPMMSSTYLPFPAATGNLNLLVHELGHALGLAHANTLDYGSIPLGALDDAGIDLEYGDPFSVMGLSLSAGGQPVMADYSAEHKALLLNWLGQSAYQQVTASGTFTLSPYESATGTRALR